MAGGRELPTESGGGGGVVVHCSMGISGRLGGICPLAEELSFEKKKKKKIVSKLGFFFEPKINPSERIYFWIRNEKREIYR